MTSCWDIYRVIGQSFWEQKWQTTSCPCFHIYICGTIVTREVTPTWICDSCLSFHICICGTIVTREGTITEIRDYRLCFDIWICGAVVTREGAPTWICGGPCQHIRRIGIQCTVLATKCLYTDRHSLVNVVNIPPVALIFPGPFSWYPISWVDLGVQTNVLTAVLNARCRRGVCW